MLEAHTTHTPNTRTDYTNVGFTPAALDSSPIPPPADHRSEMVKLLKAEITEQFGEVIHDASEIGRLPTGIESVDQILGGGLPQGRIVEVFGPESGGKSTLTLKAISSCQAQGGIPVLMDGENSFDPKYAEFLGIELSQLLQSPPQTGEETFKIAAELIKKGVDLIVIDSVTSLLPKEVLESDSIYAPNGAHALLMSQGLKYLNHALSTAQSRCIILLTNQFRAASAKSSRADTTGGRATKYYPSLRLKLESKLKPDRTEVTVTLIKNKTGVPGKKARFDIVYNRGVFDA